MAKVFALNFLTATADRKLVGRSNIRASLSTIFFAFAAFTCSINTSHADEGGISFWIPGFYGSLAATPQQPGWSLASIYYHTDVSASGNAAVAREITIGQFNPKINININANIHGVGDLGFVIPTYVFATPFLGGQASASLLMGYGNNDAALNATATATSAIGSITKSVALQQDTMGFTDLVPNFAVRWNAGVNNYMAYITGDIPVGLYSSSNLANMGLGHGAIDGGVGYSYFDPKAGHEFSAVAGFTGNFENHSTGYTSGIDFHLDWGASQFLTKQVQVGLVPVMSTNNSALTAGALRYYARSSPASSASARNSAICSPSATCGAISISKAMASSTTTRGRTAGTFG